MADDGEKKRLSAEDKAAKAEAKPAKSDAKPEAKPAKSDTAKAEAKPAKSDAAKPNAAKPAADAVPSDTPKAAKPATDNVSPDAPAAKSETTPVADVVPARAPEVATPAVDAASAKTSGAAKSAEDTVPPKAARQIRPSLESTIPVTLPLPARDANLCVEDGPEPAYADEARKDVITSVQNMLKPKGGFLTRAELLQASRELKRVTPYNYEAWRLHADVLLDALKQLETRQIQPDDNFQILAIPLKEDDIRDAVEAALRQCAHYAESREKRAALIDEANSVRRVTWF